jgi:hypothetical protein
MAPQPRRDVTFTGSQKAAAPLSLVGAPRLGVIALGVALRLGVVAQATAKLV